MPSTATKAARLTKKEMEKYRRLLDDKKASLSAELAKTRSAEEETTEESTQDIADKAVSSYTREFLYSLTDGERSTLLQIDDALGRVDVGTYGLCLNCGQLMTEKRLNAVPWAPYCLDCQELSEKGMLQN
ncbi:MAG TPA: TraR/DksA family transcriptional regulator [Thermoanaerobaculia bacterium]|nr:TraR/DksA family transcriptional regulator [Thermoanaerobaculia bacterium]HTY43072.1 TraR/DksA family transcriptional regulator [Thermoanaerobaculia bacterium]